MENVLMILLGTIGLIWLICSAPANPSSLGIEVGKHYYVGCNNSFVFAHSLDGGRVVLGGCCEFLADSFTTIRRQSIPVDSFRNLAPIRVDPAKMHSYSFATTNNSIKSWAVHKDGKYKDNLPGAKGLPYADNDHVPYLFHDLDYDLEF